MKCPQCQVTLLMMDKQGVEVDYCPECRGMWLDRGEIDKIVERMSASTGASAAPVADRSQAQPQPRQQQRSDEYEYSDQHSSYHGKPHKKKSRFEFIEDIFDF